MENGVEKPSISQDEITRTADGAVSHLNLADKVVEVFVDEEEVVGVEGEDKNDVEETTEPLVSEEIETQDEITRTADGGVSLLNLTDKVVEVFHDEAAVGVEGEDKEDVEERTEPEPLVSEEIETKTVDEAVKKDSDGDDVFEEAITDDNPPPQAAAEENKVHHFEPPVSNGDATPSEDFHSLPEVNGKTGAGELHQEDKFEEVVDTNPRNEDLSIHTVEALDKFKVADGDQLPTELSNDVVSNEQEDKEEVPSIFSAVDGDVQVELQGEPNVTAYTESGEGGAVKVVDNDDNGKELHLEESPDGLVCNRDEEENKTSGLSANGESTDAQPETNGNYVSEKMSSIRSELEDTPVVPPKSLDVGGDVAAEPIVYKDGQSVNGVFDDSLHGDTENRKTENGGSKRSELEDKPVVPTKSLDVGGDVAAEPIIYEDGQSVNGVFDDSLRVDTENRETENGGSEIMRLDEKPVVLAKPFPVDRVGSDDISMSDGCDESEKVLSERDESYAMRHTVASADSFVIEEIQTTEKKSTPNSLGVSVDQVTEAEKELSDTMKNATELGKSVSPNLEARREYENIQEAPAVHAVVKEAESRKMHDEGKKQDLTSIEASNDSGSAREPEVPPAVEPVQAPRHRPAGLGGAAPLFEPTSRALQQPRVNGAAPQRQAELVEDPASGEADGNDETREKLQMIRVKFLRLAHRLGQTPHNVVVAQVLYRLGLAEQLRGRNAGRAGAFSFDRASAMAEQLESAGQGPLDFSCTIMVLGKTGVGKSATINSIFDEIKFSTDAFQLGTTKVQDVVGTVQGIKVRVIDTPGLLPCWSDQRYNEKILQSVKRFIKKTPPDIVLYLDRLDMQNRDFGDLPLLRTITEIFGPSIWFNAIVVLTHAASAPPDGPNGVSSSYEMFVTQRSHVVQQAIRQAAGDMRLMNPVSLVENHSACRTNRAGQRVLPNGQVWKPHLLLLSFASKILAEANTLLKLQDNPPGKPFATRSKVPPLPYLLSSLLQSRPQLKLPEEQFGDEDDPDEDLDESSDSGDESEYDELPPFKRLTRAQLANLSKAQKKAYFDELEYREKLFMKKQLKEEKRRRRMLKKMAGMAKDVPNEFTENAEEEAAGGASVPVAMPDFSLPASFDSDNPSHRYRFLDTSNPWLVRPVLETHGWDHDVGYEGINVERLFVVKDKIPVSISGQATKDKKESNLQMELAGSIKHSEGRATSLGFDMQPIGKDMSYTLRSETRFSNFRNNKTAAGLCVTLLGDALTAGVKLEDKLTVNKRLRLVLTGGAMSGRGDVAYGGSLEASLRDKDYPLGRMLSTLGLSIMDWHGDLAIGCNVQTQIPIGRSSNLIARANLNNRGSGQVSIRLNSSEQLQIALVGLLPLLRKAVSLYQQSMYGE